MEICSPAPVKAPQHLLPPIDRHQALMITRDHGTSKNEGRKKLIFDSQNVDSTQQKLFPDKCRLTNASSVYAMADWTCCHKVPAVELFAAPLNLSGLQQGRASKVQEMATHFQFVRTIKMPTTTGSSSITVD
jgi:hypothetical protein